MTVLVAYASKHGSTEGIARFIAERLAAQGIEADARPVEAAADLAGIHAVVLGSAVYAGSWRKEAVEFAELHVDELVAVPVWLFSSGPLGEQVQDDEEQPRQLGDLHAKLHPRDHRMFFGALDKEKLNFGERMIMKAVKAPEGDYRDWDDIGRWTDGIARGLTSE